MVHDELSRAKTTSRPNSMMHKDQFVVTRNKKNPNYFSKHIRSGNKMLHSCNWRKFDLKVESSPPVSHICKNDRKMYC